MFLQTNVKFAVLNELFVCKVWTGAMKGVPLHSLSGTEVPAGHPEWFPLPMAGVSPKKNSVKNLEVMKTMRNFATFFAAPAREAGDSTLKCLQ